MFNYFGVRYLNFNNLNSDSKSRNVLKSNFVLQLVNLFCSNSVTGTVNKRALLAPKQT